MSATREEMKVEAIERMKLIGIFGDVIEMFDLQDTVCFTATDGLGGCYCVTDDQKKAIEDFEKENDCLVYHVIDSKMRMDPTTIFHFYNMLYVSSHDEEWSLDRDDLKQGETIAHVFNVEEPLFSESGAIGIQLSPAAGVWRTW